MCPVASNRKSKLRCLKQIWIHFAHITRSLERGISWLWFSDSVAPPYDPLGLPLMLPPICCKTASLPQEMTFEGGRTRKVGLAVPLLLVKQTNQIKTKKPPQNVPAEFSLYFIIFHCAT